MPIATAMVLVLLIATTAFIALQMMHTNTCGMAYTQPVKDSTAVRIKLLNAGVAKYFLLQQLPYFTEGLLLHLYLLIIYPWAIQCHTVYVAASANTPS